MPAQPPVVVKIGGNAAVDPDAVCADVAATARAGRPVVLVHGGSADIDRLGARLGVPARRLTAPDGITTRHTDAATLEVVQLALGGLVRPRLVGCLLAHGARAVGLSGVDGGLLRARRKTAHRAWEDGRRVVVRDVHSGRITGVDAALLHALLAAGALPVVGPPALAEDGRPVNADADRVAAAVAAGLGAAALVLLTGAPGVLADPADETSALAACAVPAQGPPPYRRGGMGLKLVAAREALAAGVPEVLIADGRRARPLTRALAGEATRIELAASADEGGTG